MAAMSFGRYWGYSKSCRPLVFNTPWIPWSVLMMAKPQQVRHVCVCSDTDWVSRVSVYGQICMQLSAKRARRVHLNVRVCLITAG